MSNTIIFMATNGAGLGHLTRSLAVAVRLRKLCPDLTIVFTTTSLAWHIVSEFGFPVHYFPAFVVNKEEKLSIQQMREKKKKWEQSLHYHLESLKERYAPVLWIYDGAMPYTALLNFLLREHKEKRVWIKRGGDKAGFETLSILEQCFDLVVIPKEIGMRTDEVEKRNRIYVPPIVLEESSFAMTRQQVREKFQVPEGATFFYVQLGAGNINDISNLVNQVLIGLLSYENNYVLYGDSVIASDSSYLKQEAVKRLYIIKEFPNSRYFPGIDAAVTACGYNTFHELLYYQIPAIYIPNRQTRKDDQGARAQRGAALHLGVVAESEDQISKAIQVFSENRSSFAVAAKGIPRMNGAQQAAQAILELVERLRIK